MTTRALQSLRLAMRNISVDRRGDVLVAAAAGVFCYLMIELRDLDGVGISAGREIERMPESVICLNRIFSDDVVRSMTVVASSDRVMARLQPGIILSSHHVTIHASGRIVRQIGISLGIYERISPQAKCQAYKHSGQNRNCRALHGTFRDTKAYPEFEKLRSRKTGFEVAFADSGKRRED